MKNISRLILLSAATLFAGCAQEEFSAPKGEGLVFTATIADATRTSIEIDGTSGKVNWVAGDEIDINGVAYVATPNTSDASTATFTKKNDSDPDPTPIDGYYYATYACTYDAAMGEGEIPASQSYSATTISAPMYAESESTSLSFKNICGVFELKLKGTDTVKSIEVSSATSEYGLAGTFTIPDGEIALISDNTQKTATLDCGDGVALDASEATSFFITVPDGTYPDIKFTVNFTDGGKQSFSRTSSLTIGANQLMSISKSVESKMNYAARYSNDGGTNWTNTETLKEAIDGITAGADKANGKVELLDDCTVTDQIKTTSQKFTLNGNGNTISITAESHQSPFNLTASTDVTFENVTIETNSYSAPGRAIYASGSTVTLGKDCLIQGFKSDLNGNGVYGTSSTINMTDNATISDCHHTNSGNFGGGGIFCEKGTVNMSDDALITGCTCQHNGGGIYVYTSGKLNMSGNATILDCTAKDYGGAATVYSSQLNMSGNATISNCTATSNGGAFYLYSCTPAISDYVRITGCTATNGYGGGIYSDANQQSVTITLTDNVKIDNCTCKMRGGGVYHSGYFVMKGNACIEKCNAKFGGAVAIWRSGTFDENALIKDCTAERGGAVYDTTGTSGYGQIIMQGSAKIESCKASKNNGGGLYIAYGNATISENAVISNNTCATYGCAICSNSSNSSVTINGGTVTSNYNKVNCAVTNGGKITVNGGCLCNTGTGGCLSRISGTINLYGGYYTVSGVSTFVPTGYTVKDNPNSTPEDIAAYDAGFIYKVVSQ